MDLEIRRNLRFNFIANLADGAFFGAALGFASFVTVIPLFVSQLTDSAILIGLIPAIHSMGWQLPQLLTAQRVAGLRRFKPMVMILSTQERLPFLGLALIAWLLPGLRRELALVLTYALLVWQGLGGGFAATAWQSLIGKIIPSDSIGTFFGAQSATANLLASLAAIGAGILLERVASPLDFTLCFLLAAFGMAISWGFLLLTREQESAGERAPDDWRAFRANLGSILRRDANFRWFLVARMLSQVAMMAFAFYTVYAVNDHGLSESAVGLMTGILMATQVTANPLMGWAGDRWGHRRILQIGVLAAVLSAAFAWFASSAAWFYPVFILAGIAYVAAWTTPMAMTLEFSSEADRPAYIGLANTLVAPSTMLAPIIGGWLADQAGYQATFLFSAVAGVLTLLVLFLAVSDPRSRSQVPPIQYDHGAEDTPQFTEEMRS
jgi:MFS family permease